ncbi:MAG TPA: cobyric acid synthase [Bacilli bacterium]|nr:cobyric acid synthase [Bacilli bacterium]
MKAIMIQGTSSDAGKSLLCTGLCRLLKNRGYRVAPFKSQNMSLNSYITRDGAEIGRAQGVQAEACGVEATSDMNPILLKPKGDRQSEIVLHGKHYRDMDTYREGRDFVPFAMEQIGAAIDRLRAAGYELLVVEGAGSPVEVNLKARDITNMRVAERLDCPVLLVADIERGGVFAQIVGTLELLSPEERARVKGLVINKFRGDLALFADGVAFLEEKTGVPVLGVIPHLEHEIDPEDSLALSALRLKPIAQDAGGRGWQGEVLHVAVIQYPRLSNFTDAIPLQDEPGVQVRYVTSPAELGQPDLILLPGSKNTMQDLLWLERQGLVDAIRDRYARGSDLVGICGGFQMLGERLFDPCRVESDLPERRGLGLLPVETTFAVEKRTIRNRGHLLLPAFAAQEVEGYEIHLGRTERKGAAPFLRFQDGEADGAVSPDGRVFGTYLHGLFQNRSFTRAFFNQLRVKKGAVPLPPEVLSEGERRERSYQRLAAHLEEHLDVERLLGLIEEQG